MWTLPLKQPICCHEKNLSRNQKKSQCERALNDSAYLIHWFVYFSSYIVRSSLRLIANRYRSFELSLCPFFRMEFFTARRHMSEMWLSCLRVMFDQEKDQIQQPSFCGEHRDFFHIFKHGYILDQSDAILWYWFWHTNRRPWDSWWNLMSLDFKNVLPPQIFCSASD